MDICELIPTGSKNAITRTELRIKTGLSDRAVRELIHDARKHHAIVNTSDGRGYFIPSDTDTDKALLGIYITQEENRIRRTKEALKGAYREYYGEAMYKWGK